MSGGAESVKALPVTVTAASRPSIRARALVRGLRPTEWVKNAFVGAPLLFAGQAGEASAVTASLTTIAAFCAVASAGYLFNDITDRKSDRVHPLKRSRPIASGALPVPVAGVAAVVLGIAGLAAAYTVSPATSGILAAYAALTFAYSSVLKQLVIIDVMAISGCFLLRVLAGSVAIDATASRWLLVCTGMIALFLGFTKRRQEALSELGVSSRPVLEHYSLPFLDQMVSLVTACTVLSYSIYATESPLVGDAMLFTVPAVLYGVFRYLYLIYHRQDDHPIAYLVTRDPGMLGGAFAWILSVSLVLYL